MTDLADKIERLSAAATPGAWYLQTGAIGINPWVSTKNWTRPDGSYARGGCILNMVAHDEREQDAELIVALRNAVPEIITALRAAQHAEALAEALQLAYESREGWAHKARAALAAYRSATGRALERGEG